MVAWLPLFISQKINPAKKMGGFTKPASLSEQRLDKAGTTD